MCSSRLEIGIWSINYITRTLNDVLAKIFLNEYLLNTLSSNKYVTIDN